MSHGIKILSPDLRLYRLARIRQELTKRNYDGAIIFSSGRHQMLRFSPSAYLLGQLTIGDAVLLIPANVDEAPQILVSPIWDESRFTQLEPYEVYGSNDLIESAIQKISLRPKGFRWAAAGAERIPYQDWKRLQTAGSVQHEHELFGRTGNKDEYERSLIRKAAKIADVGFEALLNAVNIGITEYELAAEMDYAMRRLGSEDNFGLIATGKDIQAIRPATDRRIERGDIIIAEITPEYGGYFAQLCRTIVVGSIDHDLKDKYQMMITSMKAGIRAAKPGNTVAGIVDAMDAVFIENGYEHYTRPPYMRTRGHGLGMGSSEPGNLSRQNHQTLAEGMTMIIHPNQYIPEIGYVMLGDTIEIAKDGAVSLSDLEQRLYEKQV